MNWIIIFRRFLYIYDMHVCEVIIDKVQTFRKRFTEHGYYYRNIINLYHTSIQNLSFKIPVQVLCFFNNVSLGYIFLMVYSQNTFSNYSQSEYFAFSAVLYKLPYLQRRVNRLPVFIRVKVLTLISKLLLHCFLTFSQADIWTLIWICFNSIFHLQPFMWSDCCHQGLLWRLFMTQCLSP